MMQDALRRGTISVSPQPNCTNLGQGGGIPAGALAGGDARISRPDGPNRVIGDAWPDRARFLHLPGPVAPRAVRGPERAEAR